MRLNYSSKNKKLFSYGIRHPINKFDEGEKNKMTKQTNDGFVKIEDKIFKFEKEGDMIEGELLSVEDGKTYNNKVYKIKTIKETLTVFSTTVMESQMAQVKIGDMVRILLTGFKESNIKGREDTKIFEVFVKSKE